MSQFGLFYEGVRWDIPSEGGAACLSYLSETRRLFETLFFTIIYGSLLLWCIPRLKLPIDERYAPRKHIAWITMIHCLVFGIEIGYKLTARSLIFIFNPCHALTAVQIWLLFAKPSSFVTAVFRLHLHGINGTLLALLLPTAGTRTPALRVIYFVQHILILLIPACILDQRSIVFIRELSSRVINPIQLDAFLLYLAVYSIEPLGDFHWVLTSLSIQTLYHFLFLQPLGMLTHANLNQMLCPFPADPFAGPHYRIAAMIHQPVLILLSGKLYSIIVLWLQQSIKSPNFLKPLCSSFHWLPGLAITWSNSNKATANQIICEKTVERRPRSLEELFQTQNGWFL
ncbi:Transmembrane protein [Echinococcus granulosus]|uniref:Transmembrane protein n=1 Tax=Echinococcus granulosus TaxID=6210 RepID=W6V1R9_ECHGR|nr:Transmembrane protein [Echinococcus granulosus]EUB59834.1 Transmembrane protein [Echinococcus granulosus]